MTLTAEQVKMRDNLGNKGYWEARWREDSDGVCADLLALYTVTGEETRKLISKEIDDRFSHFEAVFTENYKNMLDLVNGIEHRRKEDRRKTDRNTEQTDKNTADINLLKQGMGNQALQNDQILAMQKTTFEHVKQIAESNAPQAPQGLSNKKLASIGVGAAIGLSAVLEFVFTGESTIFKMFGFGGA